MKLTPDARQIHMQNQTLAAFRPETADAKNAKRPPLRRQRQIQLQSQTAARTSSARPLRKKTQSNEGRVCHPTKALRLATLPMSGFREKAATQKPAGWMNIREYS